VPIGVLKSVTTYAAGPESGTLSSAGVFVLALATLDLGLEAGIVIPALPVLAEHYDASLIGVAWLVTGFLLAAIVATPLFGRLGDLYGKRRMLFLSLGAFAAGSLLCALTQSIGVAITGRVIQGLGAAGAPLALGLVREGLSPDLVPRGIGAVVGAAAAGSALGLLLSGLLVDHFSAAAIFWFLFSLAVALVVAVLFQVPASPVRAGVRVDLGGAVTLGLGLAALLLAISKGSAWAWWSTRTVGLFAASAVLLTCFVLVERHVGQPLVDLRLVVARPFLNANICVFAFGYSFLIALLLIPPIAGAPSAASYGLGLSTIGIGLVLAPIGLAGLFAGWLAGKMVDRAGPRPLVAVGSLLGIATYTFLALAHSTQSELATGSTLLGLSLGFVLTGIYFVVIHGVSADKTSIAIAVNIVIRNTAAAVGAQVAVAIVTAAGVIGRFPADSGYTRAFVMGAVGAGVLLLASAFLPGRVANSR
jgi:MFS family permease